MSKLRLVCRWLLLPLVIVLEILLVVTDFLYSFVFVHSGWEAWTRARQRRAEEKFYGSEDRTWFKEQDAKGKRLD